MDRLKQRADFLAAAKGAKAPAGAFVLQARERGDAAPSRFGFTVSKKVGNAAERNRVRRRLREIGHDYVLIGRRAALGMPFDLMVSEFLGAMTRLARSDGRPLKAPHG
jgi:ribonuclease P protein component